jgi:hypothetical protein
VVLDQDAILQDGERARLQQPVILTEVLRGS